MTKQKKESVRVARGEGVGGWGNGVMGIKEGT